MNRSKGRSFSHVKNQYMEHIFSHINHLINIVNESIQHTADNLFYVVLFVWVDSFHKCHPVLIPHLSENPQGELQP